MRKKDIKPGVVYAYREGKYGETLPVMLLTADLYKGRGYRDDEGPKFRKAGAGDAPHSGRLGSPTTGYLVAIMRHRYGRKVDYDAAAERMASITLADMEATGGESLDDLIGFMLIVRLGVIIGRWDEVTAQQREEAEQEARRQAARRRSAGPRRPGRQSCAGCSSPTASAPVLRHGPRLDRQP